MQHRFFPIINSILPCLPCLLCLPLLGCTDVRNRLSPDVLAISQQTDGSVRLAVRCSQTPQVVTAETDDPLLLCDVLQAASGKEIDAGHISLLLLNGNPADIIPDCLHAQIIMPTGAVLYCTEDACAAAKTDVDESQLRAAVDAGLLPARTADLFVGDLQNGSGVSALPCMENGQLTLALCDADGICATLTEDACRGLALLGTRRKQFSLAAGDAATVTLDRAYFRIRAEETDGALHFAVTGTVCCTPLGSTAPNWIADVKAKLEAMLSAACTETAHAEGADLLLLHETAVRDGISGAAECSPADWRERLKTAAFFVDVTVRSGKIG